jgi:hypothetical protein
MVSNGEIRSRSEPIHSYFRRTIGGLGRGHLRNLDDLLTHVTSACKSAIEPRGCYTVKCPNDCRRNIRGLLLGSHRGRWPCVPRFNVVALQERTGQYRSRHVRRVPAAICIASSGGRLLKRCVMFH